jgi:hypothetical protein
MEEERGFEDDYALDLYFSDTKQSRTKIYGIDDTKVTRSGKDPKYELYRLYSVDLQKKVITEYTKKKDGSIN